MSNSDAKPILIAGAGIGGLAAAVGLREKGFKLQIVERGPEGGELQGTGLTIWTNGVQALRRLGLADAVARAGARLDGTSVWDAQGKLVMDTRVTEYCARFGVPSIGVRRSDLLSILRRACADIPIRYSTRAKGFRVEDEGVVLELEDGTEIEGSALIGADGLRSAVRAQLIGDGPPGYLGHSVWRGIGEVGPSMKGATVSMFWGARGLRGGCYPVDDRHACWFVGINTPPGGRDEPEQKKPRLLELLSGMKGALGELARATPSERILRTDVYHRPKLVPWGRGPISLIGDAAHAMPTVMGQGACQTLEDAVVLSDCLTPGESIAAGLRSYEARRLERVRWVRGQVYKIGRFQSWESPVSIWLRNTMARALASKTQKTWDGLMEFPG